MSNPPSGRIQTVPLRECWPHEAAHFTQWLAQPDNLRLLGDAIGLELEIVNTEERVGDFRADIVCKRLDDGRERLVVIENQLEPTDHNHLGQILTYAAGVDAEIIVWVAETIRPEHLAAVEWMNEKFGDSARVFAVEVKVWRIGESEPAPYFDVIAKPNDWIEKSRRAVNQSSELGLKRRQYWEAFKASIPPTFPLKCGVARESNHVCFTRNLPGAEFHAVANTYDPDTKEPAICTTLAIFGKNSNELFNRLELEKGQIEKDLGYALNWNNPANTQLKRIYLRRDEDFQDEQRWNGRQEWFKKTLGEFHRVFTPRLKKAAAEQ